MHTPAAELDEKQDAQGFETNCLDGEKITRQDLVFVVRDKSRHGAPDLLRSGLGGMPCRIITFFTVPRLIVKPSLASSPSSLS
jgi:hypothetical protein